MDSKNKYKRLRQLFRKLNIERKKHAQKIDILCNDFVAVHRDFIKTFQAINFTTNFYESIVGETELGNLLDTAGQAIKEQIGDANVAFFLRWQNSFKLHMFENTPISLEQQDIINCFTPELVVNICEANKQCSLDELLEMDLHANPAMLKDISALTIPLGQFGLSLGFILIYYPSKNVLPTDNLNRISSIIPGLSRAITACRMLVQTTD